MRSVCTAMGATELFKTHQRDSLGDFDCSRVGGDGVECFRWPLSGVAELRDIVAPDLVEHGGVGARIDLLADIGIHLAAFVLLVQHFQLLRRGVNLIPFDTLPRYLCALTRTLEG